MTQLSCRSTLQEVGLCKPSDGGALNGWMPYIIEHGMTDFDIVEGCHISHCTSFVYLGLDIAADLNDTANITTRTNKGFRDLMSWHLCFSTRSSTYNYEPSSTKVLWSTLFSGDVTHGQQEAVTMTFWTVSTTIVSDASVI